MKYLAQKPSFSEHNLNALNTLLNVYSFLSIQTIQPDGLDAAEFYAREYLGFFLQAYVSFRNCLRQLGTPPL